MRKSFIKMPKAFPDRWEAYSACGKVIEGTRIICFKVPLKTSIQTNNPEIKEIWDVNTLLQTIPNLGLVIDLTYTKRYYEPNLVKSAGVDHLKLLMPGRMLPPRNVVTEFMGAIDDFLQNDKDRLVGVHCTHGLNRTGYMVCRYMRDRMGVPATEAIQRFEFARGHKMERKVYIDDILNTTPGLENLRTDGTENGVNGTDPRKNGTTEEHRGSPYHEERERRDSATDRHSSPSDWRKERRDRSPHDKHRETEDRRSPNSRHREEENDWSSSHDSGRFSCNRQRKGTRDSRRSLFEQEQNEIKNSRRSSCYEIDYSFDY